jgi:lipoate---protein ligase
MLFLLSKTDDPYINLATEEFLLKHLSEDVIFIYTNTPCVIVGKHQNALAEINYRFLTEQNIPLIRRISGGGTVYHDPGNINFSFVRNGEEGNLVNFRSFIEPIVGFLNKLGVAAEISSRNDILVNGLKVSGNAEHIYKKRTLHHGTLLFSSQLNNLRNALSVTPGKYIDKAVKSVRSHVANINVYSPENLTTEVFKEDLCQYLFSLFNAVPYNLTPDANIHIQESIETRYKQIHWNFGYSPNYAFMNKSTIGPFNLTITMKVERGIIQDTSLIGNLDSQTMQTISSAIVQEPHTYESLNRKIMSLESDFLSQEIKKELNWLLF